MEKYKVNIDRPRPRSEEIGMHRDFDALLSQYKAAAAPKAAKPFYKTGWFFGALAGVAVLTTTTVVLLNNSSDSKTPVAAVQPNVTQPAPTGSKTAAPTTDHIPSVSPVPSTVNPAATASVSAPANSSHPDQYNANAQAVAASTSNAPATLPGPTASYPFIKAPLKNLDVKQGHYAIQAQKGGEVKYASGSIVTIPANAFVDANGNTVTGEVDVHYREFHDAVDFLCSGIPMHYDSTGKHFDFVSAGMMEINAFQNGKEVFLKTGEKMSVELASNESDGNFNLYRLNAATKQWEYLGKDKAKTLAPKPVDPNISRLIAERDARIDSMMRASGLVLPEMPRLADKNKLRFNIDIDTLEFPELALYAGNGALFEVIESPAHPFDKSAYTITWEDIVLSKSSMPGRYVLNLRKGLTRMTLDVYPVYEASSKGYQRAMSRYQLQQQNYMTAKSDLERRQKALRETYASRINAIHAQNSTGDQSEFTATVMRAFEISSFGIFNSDRPEQYPVGASFNAKLVKDDGSLLNSPGFYLVDKQKNGLFTYTSNPAPRFCYNPDSDNMIWAVANEKLYLCTVEEFRNITKTANVSVPMKRIDRSFSTPQELRAFLKL